MQKKLIVLQDGNKDCGSAALLSIIRYYGGNISLSRLVEMTKTTKEGTNFYNISKTALELGLETKSYKIKDLTDLKKLSCPMLCQLVNNNYTHFIVVYEINDKVLLMDPAEGKVTMDKETFLKRWTGYTMIFNPVNILPNYITKNYLNKLLIEILLNNRKNILNIFILSIIFTITSCIYTFYLEVIINYVLNKTGNLLFIISLAFALMLFTKNICSYLRNELLIYLNTKIDYSLLLETFKRILLLPYNYYKNKTTGEIISRINDLTIIKNMVNRIIITVFLDLLVSVVSGVILFKINSTLFLFLILIVITFLIIFWLFNPHIKKLTIVNQENNAKINSYLYESINGFETVKGLNITDYVSNKMESIYLSSLKENVRFDKLCNLELFLKELVSSFGIFILTYLGITIVMDSTISLGDLITFTSLIVFFINPIKNIIDLNKEFHYTKNSLKRANNLFEVPLEELTTNFKEIRGDIKINNLNYAYNLKYPILQNINLSISKGEKVLILGKSGTGKSTLLKLLYKYYECSNETIFLDNIDINNYNLSSIRNNITFISQSEILFNSSIKENILLGKNESKDFSKVCELTYTSELITKSILGYDMILEENGSNISGGQRQRIILARALLKQSNILLIDEGLNEIDIDLERKILKNIFNYYPYKTIIIISHRTDNMDLYNKVIKFTNNGIDVLKRNN